MERYRQRKNTVGKGYSSCIDSAYLSVAAVVDGTLNGIPILSSLASGMNWWFDGLIGPEPDVHASLAVALILNIGADTRLRWINDNYVLLALRIHFCLTTRFHLIWSLSYTESNRFTKKWKVRRRTSHRIAITGKDASRTIGTQQSNGSHHQPMVGGYFPPLFSNVFSIPRPTFVTLTAPDHAKDRFSIS